MRAYVSSSSTLPRLDGQLAAAGHGVAGVDGQVHDDLLDLAGVGLDRPRPGSSDGGQLDVLADHPAEHLLDVGRPPR